MKKILLILLVLPLFICVQAQTPQGINYQAVAYDSNGLELVNQEISVRLGILLETTAAETSYTETHQVSTNDFGLFSLVISEGNTIDDFSTLNWENGAFLKVELDANLDGDYLLMGINSFSSVPYSLFAENIPMYYSEEIDGLVSEIGGLNNEIDSLENIVEMVSQYFGCKDHDACNYNAEATMSDNSCTYALEGYTCDSICIDTDMDGVCDLDEIEGCTDATACNYIVGATDEDESCVYQLNYHNCQGDCENDDDGDGICDELEEGCTDETADNYNPQVLSSSYCLYLGCTDNTSGNYNPFANEDDGSCISTEACQYPEYLEYDSTAVSSNANLCQTLIVIGCMEASALNYNPDANVSSECNHIYGCKNLMADNYNADVTYDDGSCTIYGCTDSLAGNYNVLSNTDDGSCLVAGCVIELAENYNQQAQMNDGSCIIYGCILEAYPNYNNLANVDNGSCDLNSTDVFGCTDSFGFSYNPDATIDNGDCLIMKVGAVAYGGLVVYVDENGSTGLVVAPEDIEGTFEWGCYNQNVDGADGDNIGSGLQNTMDIINFGCSSQDSSLTAAQVCFDYEIDGFTDWYLPSSDELFTLYNIIESIAISSLNEYVWSSSEQGNQYSYTGNGHSQTVSYHERYDHLNVRPIRNFYHNIESGCNQENACNFNPDVLLGNGQCLYPALEYDCDGDCLFDSNQDGICDIKLHDNNIQDAVESWVSDSTLAEGIYGHISLWDVSNVTDMQDLFNDKLFFNSDISEWNVSNVSTMYNMFRNANSFNSNISEWDVSNVTNMYRMFDSAFSFNSDISSWDVSMVTDMRLTFVGATSFNSDISGWNVSNGPKMSQMFQNATSFNSDISAWNVSMVTSISHMFYNATSFNSDISGWDVSNVTTMERVFSNATTFNSDISGWDVSNVSDMYLMFYYATSFNSDISEWDVSMVTNMSHMFYNSTSFNCDISQWDLVSFVELENFYSGNSLSDVNRCAIHNSFSNYMHWSYDWSSYCE